MGRRATGKTRPMMIEVGFDEMEDEFISRLSFDHRMSKAAYIRSLLPDRKVIEKTIAGLRSKQSKIYGITRNG